MGAKFTPSRWPRRTEGLRSPAETSKPDVRQLRVVALDLKSEQYRRKTLQDQYRSVQRLTLSRSVPENVVICFETARNLWLYSWFVYRFMQVAELQACAALEMALRTRLNIHTRLTLHPLLRQAVQQNLLRASDVQAYGRARRIRSTYRTRVARASGQPLLPDPPGMDEEYLKGLNKLIPAVRNKLAHGSTTLDSSAYHTLEICCDLINQLFPHMLT